MDLTREDWERWYRGYVSRDSKYLALEPSGQEVGTDEAFEALLDRAYPTPERFVGIPVALDPRMPAWHSPWCSKSIGPVEDCHICTPQTWRTVEARASDDKPAPRFGSGCVPFKEQQE